MASCALKLPLCLPSYASASGVLVKLDHFSAHQNAINHDPNSSHHDYDDDDNNNDDGDDDNDDDDNVFGSKGCASCPWIFLHS